MRQLQNRIEALVKELKRWIRTDQLARGLATVPGVGLIATSALAATVTDPDQFTSSQQSAAWQGLTPRANSSGGKRRQGPISKMGDQHIRRLLVSGMNSKLRPGIIPMLIPALPAWLARKPAKLVTVASALDDLPAWPITSRLS